MTARVVLVRPWTDAHGGTGCCSGEPRDGVCLDQRQAGADAANPDVRVVAEAFRRLRSEVPEVDVQIVGAGNTVYLLPTTFRAVLRRRGLRAALVAAGRATAAGAVLLDGERVGDVGALGADGVVRAVRDRLAMPAAREG